MERCDVLVVGAGIAGASAAYELAAAGRVIVLERENLPGYHTTGRSAALFTETYGNPLLCKLTAASRGFFESPPPGFAEHPLLGARGALTVARDDQRDRLARAVAEAGPGIVAISVADALRRVPVLRPDYVAAAAYEAGARDIDVHGLHDGYLRGLRARGGTVVTAAEVRRLVHERGEWRAETAGGAFAGAVLVNAAGAWGDEIAGLAGAPPVGLVPKRRTAIAFDPPAGVEVSAWPFTIDVAETFYFKPEAGRILASPADHTPVAPGDAQPEELDVALAVDRIEKATLLRVDRIARKWAGLRSFVADETPVVGIDDAAPGFFWLIGQGGSGMMTAPALARAAAALIAGGSLPEDLRDLGIRPADLAPGRLR